MQFENYDPYDCLIDLKARVDSLETNLENYIKNQMVLNTKLDSITRLLHSFPEGQTLDYQPITPQQIKTTREDMLWDFGPHVQANSSKIKGLIRRLGKK